MAMIGNVISVAACAALLALLIALLARYFAPRFSESKKILSDKYARPDGSAVSFKEIALCAAGLFLLSRAVIILYAVISANVLGDFGRLNINNWIKWDANHYVGLAKNWYVNEGDARFHIVFFPLYPAVLRIPWLLFGWNPAIFGVVLSNVCLIVCAVALFRLCEMEYGSSRAYLAMSLFLFSPTTFFFSLPYSESAFFMLSVLSALMARRKKFALAIALGALASATRLLGLLSAVVIYYEFIRNRDGLKPFDYAKYALFTSAVSLGFLSYLWLNWSVTGSPMTFLKYQSEHWSQNMGTVANTLKYTFANACEYSDENIRLGTWIPQLAAIIIPIALLLGSYRTITPGDGAYAILYIWFALSPTWLLSGARYISAMYPVYFMFPKHGSKLGVALTAVSGVIMLYMFDRYLGGGVM